jgi:hypothetical protein
MIKFLKYVAALLLVIVVIAFSIFMPATLARYYDNSMFGVVYKDSTVISPESFQYSTLSERERLNIVSMALGNRNIMQSDYAASIREKATRSGRDDTVMTFAYVENTRGPSADELNAEQAIEACKVELTEIIRSCFDLNANFDVTELNLNPCSEKLYSAVYMLEPQKNVPVWQIEYSSAIPPTFNDRLPFVLMEAYVDAETGKLYGFAFRLEQADTEDFEPDALAKAWLDRLSIASFEDITDDKLFTENASLYKKFAIDGMDSAKTVFTVGFYEGVNEFFVRCY